MASMGLEGLLGSSGTGDGTGNTSVVVSLLSGVRFSIRTNSGRSLVVSVLVVTVLVLVLSANLGLELGQGNGGQDGVLVDDGSVVDLLVDGDGGVNVGVLDGLTVDDGLDGLVDVVVDVLGGNGRGGSQSPVHITDLLGIPVKGPLLLELLPVLGEHIMLALPRNLGDDIVLVLSRSLNLIDDGLNSVLVVVDVPLPVDGLDLLDGLVTRDVLLDDGGGGLGADLGGVGLVGAGQEGLDVVDHTSGRTGSGSVGVGGGVGGSHCCYFFRG